MQASADRGATAGSIFAWLAPACLLASVLQFLGVLHARAIVPDLTREVTREGLRRQTDLPTVSVVIPARDEAPSLRHALPTVLSQDYPRLEVVVVNDRSSDHTQAVAEAAVAGAAADGAGAPPGARGLRAVVQRIDALPAGWLGKTHALYQGARSASGEWLLFADADVCFEPTALRRAVQYAEKESLDHLTLIPKLDLAGYWLRGVVAFFYMSYMIMLGRYRTNVPGSRVGLGIGAFNLLRRDAYGAVGSYAALRLSAADDLALGRAVKRAGFKQRVLTAVGTDHEAPLVRLRWYDSLPDFFRGVEKNVLPICGYNPLAVGLVALTSQLTSVLPMLAPLFAGVRHRRVTSAAYAAAATLNYASSVLFGGHQRHPRPLVLALGQPVCGALSCYALLRAATTVLKAGGVTWRGTFYPLRLLRDAERATAAEPVAGPRPGRAGPS